MIGALIAIICILSVFTAVGLACAVGIALRRDPGIGLRRDTQADPFFHPFGDVPGFTAEQLRAMSRTPHPRDPLQRSFTHDHFDSAGLALRSDADGGRPVPSWLVSISRFFRGVRNA